MSKELETFKVHYEKSSNQWYLQIHFNNAEFRVIQLPLLPDEAKDIQNLLNKNSKPNEALECLENLKKQAIAFERSELAIKVANGNADTIKQALIKTQEQENVLKIIFEKQVNFEVFGAFETYKDYEIYYNKRFHLIEHKLTEEEFDLLTRYLK